MDILEVNVRNTTQPDLRKNSYCFKQENYGKDGAKSKP